MVHRNTNMIHLPNQSPDQTIVLNEADDQIILNWESYLGCVCKSTIFTNCAEDAHCSRKLIDQSGVCPFIPEHNYKEHLIYPMLKIPPRVLKFNNEVGLDKSSQQ